MEQNDLSGSRPRSISGQGDAGAESATAGRVGHRQHGVLGVGVYGLSHPAQGGSGERRFCHVCDRQISSERLLRSHNARTCDDACSPALRVAQKRGAVTRYRRRLRRRLAQGRAAALVDVANCVVCRSMINADRRARWPHVVTCSAGCAAEHQKGLVRQGKRRRRQRLKPPPPATDPT